MNVIFLGVQAPSTATVMLSSGSDSSRENSPRRTAPSRQEEREEKKSDSDGAGSTDTAVQVKGKQPMAISSLFMYFV
jgi:hypothetical protein